MRLHTWNHYRDTFRTLIPRMGLMDPRKHKVFWDEICSRYNLSYKKIVKQYDKHDSDGKRLSDTLPFQWCIDMVFVSLCIRENNKITIYSDETKILVDFITSYKKWYINKEKLAHKSDDTKGVSKGRIIASPNHTPREQKMESTRVTEERVSTIKQYWNDVKEKLFVDHKII